MSILLDSFHLNGLKLRFQTNYKCALSLQNRSGYRETLMTLMQSAFYVKVPDTQV